MLNAKIRVPTQCLLLLVALGALGSSMLQQPACAQPQSEVPKDSKEAAGMEENSTAAEHSKSAREFLIEYFDCVARAKSLSELAPFYADDRNSKAQELLGKNRLLPGPGDLLIQMMHFEPGKVKIVSESDEPGERVRFSLIPEVVPQQFVQQSKTPGFSMTGSVVLLKQDGKWKVHKDYWVVKSQNGKEEMSFGLDPDGEQKKTTSMPSFSRPEPSDYEGKLRNKLMDQWSTAGTGKGDVTAAFKLGTNGRVGELHLKDKNNSTDSEAFVRQQLLSMPPVVPVTASIISKPYAWMTFHWKGNSSFSISGPYFDTMWPEHVCFSSGIKIKPSNDAYKDAMLDKIMKAQEKQKGSGLANVYLKLKSDGSIEKIFVKTNPTNPAVEKAAYEIFCRAHPFGRLPATLSPKPYFHILVNWSPDGRSAGFPSPQIGNNPPAWLK